MSVVVERVRVEKVQGEGRNCVRLVDAETGESMEAGLFVDYRGKLAAEWAVAFAKQHKWTVAGVAS